MQSIKIPAGIQPEATAPYSRELLLKYIRESSKQEETGFTGYISIESDSSTLFLFFFNSAIYSAGISVGGRPSPLLIGDFLLQAKNISDSNATISLHQTDPVLLKCLLVFIQDQLTAKAPVSLINLETLLQQIQKESADALIILEKGGAYNLFFFKDGTKGKAYYADSDFSVETELPIDEQLLVYALQGGNVVVNVMIYRTLITEPADDLSKFSQKEIESAFDMNCDETVIFNPSDTFVETVELTFMEGVLKGKKLNVRIPCVIGRKDADLVIPDPMVSKRHLKISKVDSHLEICDLKSTNGVYLNGKRIGKSNVEKSDVISIGETQFKAALLG